MSNICFKCGVENSAGAKVCEACKKPLKVKKVKEKPLTLPLNSDIKENYTIMGLVTITDLGAVYLVEDKRSHEIYALKELRPSRASSEEEKEYTVNKFVNEGKLLQQLNFISVPRVVEYFVFEDNHYIVMEFIEGLDMESMVKTTGTPGLPQDLVIRWGIQICDVLDYLHNCDPIIIYRDLKPANIMIRNSDNNVVLIDFGIALPLHEELKGSSRTQIGTMGYMAPEQFQGKVSPSSDIFSLGATLYYALTGQVQQLFNYISIASFIPDVSEELDNIIKRTLQISPASRFTSARELKTALEDLRTSLSQSKINQDKELKIALENMETPSNLIFTAEKISKVKSEAEEFNKTKNIEKKLEIIKNIEKIPTDEATKGLIRLLLDSEKPVLSCALIESLGKRKDPDIIKALVKKIKDKDIKVKLASIELLGNYKEKEAVDGIINCLKSKNKEVKKSAIITLGNTGSKIAMEALIKARKKEGLFNIDMKSTIDDSIEILKYTTEGKKKPKKKKSNSILYIIKRFFQKIFLKSSAI